MEEYHWKEILPIDGYTVVLNGLLYEYDRQILTLLYQPLVGSLATSLYLTLWNEVTNQHNMSQETTHHSLLSLMQISLKDIFSVRQKLEGIGLLSVYVKQGEGKRSFIYEIHPPLTPEKFFNDPLLNVFLFGRLGSRKYNEIKQYFSKQKPELIGYKNITRSFYDVFQTVSQTQFAAFEEYKKEQEDNVTVIGRQESKQLLTDGFEFNYSSFFREIEHYLLSKKVITPAIKELVGKLAFLYGLTPIEMAVIVVDAREGEEAINEEKIRKFAREKYQFKHDAQLPTLIERVQPKTLQAVSEKKPTTKEEVLISKMENTSPLDFLIALMGGAQPSQSDIKILEGIMINQKLSPGVVNVLIHYVLLKTDMKLTKGYVEKIASHWVRKKVKTVREAMDLAKQEHESYQEWTKTKNQSKKGTKVIRKEIVPDWAVKKDVAKPKSEKKEEVKEQERAELQELLKQFKKE